MKLRNILSIQFLLALAAVCILTIATLVAVFAFVPHQSEQPFPKTLIIRSGEGLSAIAQKLEQEDLIQSRFFFKWFSIALGNLTTYKKGEYLIEDRVSVMELVKLLEEGRSILVSVTFPEGLRMTEMFTILEESGFQDRQTFQSLSRSREFIASIDQRLSLGSLEGFLFPETYTFAKNTQAGTILKTMVSTFWDRIPDNYDQLAQSVGLSFYEAVTLASIIEKETSVASERKLISSVFHNRLKRNMRLQTDPTVIYGIENFDGNLTRKQLRTPSPYNTYINEGLPPTPIANPGFDSLLAAVQPAESDYIFFVAKGDGTHEFTTNYKDHSRAVYKYQHRRTSNYRSF